MRQSTKYSFCDLFQFVLSPGMVNDFNVYKQRQILIVQYLGEGATRIQVHRFGVEQKPLIRFQTIPLEKFLDLLLYRQASMKGKAFLQRIRDECKTFNSRMRWTTRSLRYQLSRSTEFRFVSNGSPSVNFIQNRRQSSMLFSQGKFIISVFVLLRR